MRIPANNHPPTTGDTAGGGARVVEDLLPDVPVVIAAGKRPATFRTRKLSPPAPMVLHSGGCGRVGHRRTQRQRRDPTSLGPSFLCLTSGAAAAPRRPGAGLRSPAPNSP